MVRDLYSEAVADGMSFFDILGCHSLKTYSTGIASNSKLSVCVEDVRVIQHDALCLRYRNMCCAKFSGCPRCKMIRHKIHVGTMTIGEMVGESGGVDLRRHFGMDYKYPSDVTEKMCGSHLPEQAGLLSSGSAVFVRLWLEAPPTGWGVIYVRGNGDRHHNLKHHKFAWCQHAALVKQARKQNISMLDRFAMFDLSAGFAAHRCKGDDVLLCKPDLFF